MKGDFIARKEVYDFGVEDPNDDFQMLRDICDVEFLLQEVEKIKKSLSGSNNLSLEELLDRPVVTSNLGSIADDSDTKRAIAAVIENIKNGVYKLSKIQSIRCIEMLNLKFLNRSNKQQYKEYRLLVKRRLFQRNEEILSGMDENEMKQLKNRMGKEAAPKRSAVKKTKSGEDSAPRKPSPYNLFMKTELPKVKADNPTLAHKEAFKLAASNWKNSPDN
ncbi:hypothetical protein HK100_000672, partial [Physocladia obscura]